jgi:transposase
MIDMLKRHEVQVLRRVGHTLMEVAALSGVSVGTVRRIEAEAAVETVNNGAERARRQIGRPSKAEAFRAVLREALQDEATLRGKSVAGANTDRAAERPVEVTLQLFYLPGQRCPLSSEQARSRDAGSLPTELSVVTARIGRPLFFEW